MSYHSKLAMLFVLALFAAPFTASAHPAIPGSGLISQAAVPAVKVGCYYEECEEVYIRRRRCWRYCDCGGGCGYYHRRYYSHYRWGSYHRYWRRRRCCGGSGWGDD